MAEKAEDQAFVSKLGEGRERFLAHVIEHGLEVGLRSPEDFIRHFPPSAIMMGLKNQPALRAQILVLTVGVKQKIAIRKSAESAAEDLQIALDEGETDAESIVAILAPDDRIRYLPAQALWAYAIEPEFWKATPSKGPEFERARTHIAFMLERALTDKLVTHRDIVEGVTVEELATRLPRSEMGKLVKRALENAGKKAPFTEVDLLSALPLAELVKHIPLAHIWENVVLPRVAQKHGYLAAPGASATAGAAPAERATAAEKAGAEKPALAEKAAAPAEKATAPAEKAADAAKPAAEAASATRPASVAPGWDEPSPAPAAPPPARAPMPSTEEMSEEDLGDVMITDDDIRIG
jgi:hypothetical protein